MKIKFLLLLMPLFAISQSKPYYKQTITAYEINKKDTINKKILVSYLDSLRKIITTENNISNAISGSILKSGKTHSVIEVDTDRLYVSADIDQKGDTIGKLIYVYDEKKNRTENYQIRKADTINGQKRLYNESGKCTKLYNRRKVGHKYFLSTEWDYDSNGNTTQCKTYNESGALVGFDRYENVYKKNEFITTKYSYSNHKGFVKELKEIKKDSITTTYFYSNSVGYNYGIKISNVDGGMRIQEEDENGNMKELKIFDSNGNLIVYVKNSEIRLHPKNK
ncbi:hypothetical protein [Flavobacterium granuli]|uniref:YD repeat-containing protein n=1 Tax=Flavobacterium granuli TaxID=280093 RepID=A0A1M5QIT1_9FLAO|nr:hypothetical protein [Flavobacterium granuli]PRZ20106.1 hypothetical protein BC624_11366 [Flavobacterium granuli]SHH13710.1 hypothetical protein SAMN05443373_1089 [Flavobacterium granuli]